LLPNMSQVPRFHPHARPRRGHRWWSRWSTASFVWLFVGL
jgi:hypothetical protein